MAINKIETDILILGAGWSGLLAADLLSKKCQNMVILENEPKIGGLAKTFDFKGFKFDIGGHRLCFRDPKNINYIKSIIPENDLLRLKTKAKILFKGKYVNYPVSMRSLFEIDKRIMIKIFFDMFKNKSKSVEGDFESWVISNYGKTLHGLYFKDYTEKVWGRPCDGLSSHWADKRIGRSGLFRFIKRVFLRDGIKENIELFYYPKLGMEALISGLERKIRGVAKIYTGTQLKRFYSNADRLDSLVFIANGQEHEITFKNVVSTIPIQELTAVLPDNSKEIMSGLEGGLTYRSLILVGVIVTRDLVTDWHWCYFPDKEIIFSRIHEPKYWSKRLGRESQSLLCLEIFCDYGDTLWSIDDSELTKRVGASLQKTGIVENRDLTGEMMIKRLRYAYPLHYKKFEVDLNQVMETPKSFKNLHLMGRNGTYSYFDMEECIEDVKYKASAI